ncbi:MAG: cyclic nucleotide-binding domain-containing protein [Verrucomicrobiales bacterium]|nr:cyclic nucleotide-binding domain-containing protein [Verrucomicrobiales bacterium]MCP5526710.1 cyclic nucleotide-binding domain-containing protein [Verrucomicrobiales bacterium]
MEQSAPMYRYWGPDLIAYGPVELPAFIAWIKQGRVKADTWVHLDETRTWTRASGISELKMFFRSRAGAGEAAPPGASGQFKAENLRRIKLFAEMDHQQLESLLNYLEVVKIPKFSLLFKEGDPADSMFSIVEGELRARRMVGPGQEKTLFTWEAGESFGETALLTHGPRSADVVANEDSTLLKLPEKDFIRITTEAPALATPFLLQIGKTITLRSLKISNDLIGTLVRRNVAGEEA